VFEKKSCQPSPTLFNSHRHPSLRCAEIAEETTTTNEEEEEEEPVAAEEEEEEEEDPVVAGGSVAGSGERDGAGSVEAEIAIAEEEGGDC